MSLRGRYMIDRTKRAIDRYLRLPVPPYGSPEYWDGAYKSFGPEDSYEWGDISLPDVKEYEYTPLTLEGTAASTSPIASSLGDALNIHPHAENDEPILMLGCGNSRMGEEMIEEGWRGPIIQVDVSARVIESMSHRNASLIEEGHMNFIQDDATELSAFRDSMVSACIDKGLLDAVFCADEYQQCNEILSSVHRVLRPGGSLVAFSFSKPQFLLTKLAANPLEDRGRQSRRRPAAWADIQVQELPNILLYRFIKPSNAMSSPKLQRSRRR